MKRMVYMNGEKPFRDKTNKSKKKSLENGFVCRYCGRVVSNEAPGTRHRNHCPWCLRSVHVDADTGDRSSSCGGIMEPIAVSVRNGEWILIHRCTGCGTLKANRIAGDDNELALLSLAVRPVAHPPFPLDRLSPGNE
jgi:hypothetical protein